MMFCKWHVFSLHMQAISHYDTCFRCTIPSIILGQTSIFRKANASECETPQPLMVYLATNLRGKSKCKLCNYSFGKGNYITEQHKPCFHDLNIPLSNCMQEWFSSLSIETLELNFPMQRPKIDHLVLHGGQVYMKSLFRALNQARCALMVGSHFLWHQPLQVEHSIQHMRFLTYLPLHTVQ